MTEFMHLVGSEDISRAGSSIIHAAEQINNAASIINESTNRLQLFLNDWLFRLEEVLRENNK